MNIDNVISELRAEYQQLTDAITHLERLAQSTGKRRGRPPKWISEEGGTAKLRKKRKPFSAATKRKMAAAQRKRWAAKRAS